MIGLLVDQAAECAEALHSVAQRLDLLHDVAIRLEALAERGER